MPFRSLVVALAMGAALAVAPLFGAHASTWHTWNGGDYQLTAHGHLSCHSYDGNNCEAQSWDAELLAWFRNGTTASKPLVCGDDHARYYGTTGYDRPDHWCNTVYASLFAEWKDYTPLGHQYMLSTTPEGHVMCHSSDGVHCTEAHNFQFHSGKRKVKPLICGVHHRQIWGTTGYDEPGHWCATPEIIALVRPGTLLANQEVSLDAQSPWGKDFGVVVNAEVSPGRSLRIKLRPKDSNGDDLDAPTELRIGGGDAKAADRRATLEAVVPNATGRVSAAMRLASKGVCFFMSDGLDQRESVPFETSRTLEQKRPGVHLPSHASDRTVPSISVHAGSEGPVWVKDVLLVASRVISKGIDETGKWWTADVDSCWSSL